MSASLRTRRYINGPQRQLWGSWAQRKISPRSGRHDQSGIVRGDYVARFADLDLMANENPGLAARGY